MDGGANISTVATLTVSEELAILERIAADRGWMLRRISDLRFHLGSPARDGSWFYLLVDCSDYPAIPPAWHWADASSDVLDQPKDIPQGSGFLHPNGVICAPWNRLAYKAVDSRGPHGEWLIGDWRNNSYTGKCKTLPAMALRIFVELNSLRYLMKRKNER